MKLRLSSSGKFRLRSAVAFAIASIVAPETPPPVGEDPIDNTASVSVAELPANWGYQRIGTSKDVTRSGTCTGAVTTIEARVIKGATAVTAWSTIATPSGGSWSGALSVPQGHGYKWEYRARTAVGVSPTLTSTNTFGVGIFGLLIGQSNMVIRCDGGQGGGFRNPLGDPRAFEVRAGVAKRIGNLNDSKPVNMENIDAGYAATTVQNSRPDGYVLLANLLAQALDLPVWLVEKANGGTVIDKWVTTGTGTSWTAAVAALNQAGGDCEFALWHQGESDANLMSTATMKGHLAQVMLQCHQQTGRNASNFHFGVIALGSGSYNTSSEGEFGNMRAAHVEFATSTPGAYLSTCAHDVQTGDGVHITGEGYNRMVKRDARSLCNRFGAGVSGAGPRVTGATRSGLQVTLAIAHNGGTALVDGAGGNGSALTGFQFADAGAAGALIAYTTIISGGSIVCTLASAPVGALTVSYAMMNNPHNSDPNDSKTAVVLASVPYDNVVLHRTTNGCPLQPFAPITVTGA